MMMEFLAAVTPLADPTALPVHVSGALDDSFWLVASAMASIIVAGVTGWLAYQTQQMAKATRELAFDNESLLEADDLRFRQSRMPMVAVSKTYRESGGVFMELRNDGDGPALNVILTFEAVSELIWNEQKDVRKTNVERERFTAFMAVGESGACSRLFRADPGVSPGFPGGQSSITFSKLTIEYEDVFGEKYLTEHDPAIGGELVPRRFTWKPPEKLLKRSSDR